jgi:hypothetical protein
MAGLVLGFVDRLWLKTKKPKTVGHVDFTGSVDRLVKNEPNRMTGDETSSATEQLKTVRNAQSAQNA